MIAIHQTCQRLYYYKFNKVSCTSYELSINIGNVIYLDCSDNYNGYINLKTLNLTKLVCNDYFTDSDIIHLPNLTFLNIRDSHITDKAIRTLTKLTYLNCGYAYNSKITDISLCKLSNLTQLNCGDHPSDNMTLSNLINLSHLNCGFACFSDNSIKGLKLTHLNCEMCS